MKEIEEIKNLIFNSDIHQSIELAASLIRDINASDYYDLNVTDIEIALINKFDEINNEILEVEREAYKDCLFVISKGYEAGGHTRLMENLSQMISSKPVVLITRPTERSVIIRFEKYFEEIITCYKHISNDIQYIRSLAKEIANYKKVVLNTHPDDIHTVVACDIAKKFNKDLKVYFVNHADHIATYGVTVSDIWYEISLSGQHLDKFRGILPETKISFLGIPMNKLKSSFFEKVDYNYCPDGNRFLTAASSYKYDSNNDVTLIPLLKNILTINSNNRVSIISSGIKFNSGFKKLKKKYPNRVRFHSSLPYDEYIRLSEDTDFYIDSFPIPGGTAFVEQFMNSKPCIGLRTNFHGYTPLELVKRNTVDEVVELLMNPPSNSFLDELNSKIFEVHGFEKVAERFLSNLYENKHSINPMEKYIEETKVVKGIDFNVSVITLYKIFSINKCVFLKFLFKKNVVSHAFSNLYKSINVKFIPKIISKIEFFYRK